MLDRIKIITIIIVSGAILAFMATAGFELSARDDDSRAYTRQNLIRLHVVANSDQPEDQMLKYRIRDAVLQKMQKDFADGDDPEQVKRKIESEKEIFVQAADAVLEETNSNLSASASFGRYHFPERTYGDMTLPEGEYRALRVVIGEGRGTNWWCVLFPPLCFIEIAQSQKSLRGSEHDLLPSSENEVAARFRLLESFDLNLAWNWPDKIDYYPEAGK